MDQLGSSMRLRMKRYCLHLWSCSLMKIKLRLVLLLVVFSETESGG
jgi:hypothetical protein